MQDGGNRKQKINDYTSHYVFFLYAIYLYCYAYIQSFERAKPCGHVFLIFTLDARDISGSRNELVWRQVPAEDKSKPLYGSFRTVMARSG
jgi:hypothetical protein